MISRVFKGRHVAFVDDEDARLLLGVAWHVHKGRHTFYLSRLEYLDGTPKRVYLHRKLLNAEPGIQVDHRDWCAQIKVAGKKSHLGSFSLESDAALAYNKTAKKSFGEFAQLNVL